MKESIVSHESDTRDPKQLVAQGYDQVADAYAQLEHTATWPRMRWLEKLLALLPARAAILDLGCGSGDPADIALAHQHHVTGVDISEAQIIKARQNVPSGTFLHADLGSIAFSPGSFDAVVSFYTLEHLPREEHAAIFGRIATWLKPGGYLLLGTEAVENAGSVGTWLGVPMFFSSYDSATVQYFIRVAGMVLQETAIERRDRVSVDSCAEGLNARTVVRVGLAGDRCAGCGRAVQPVTHAAQHTVTKVSPGAYNRAGDRTTASLAALASQWLMRSPPTAVSVRKSESVSMGLLILALPALALAFYISTLAPTVLWGDDAFFQRSAFDGTLPRDGGGHWLWFMLARAIVHILPGEVAYKVNLLSALAGTATIVILVDNPKKLPGILMTITGNQAPVIPTLP
jgi:SAM-dependent methyltransferase